ncbi:MAG: glycosyltransferase family 4 protein [Planctomycetaceae bacterium]|jgi:glycosyltransferase involved in cell wall biosynthesis|nr:glycosyltransferase family 4 protein [Planctomycetaceae bacterium]
MRVLFLVQYPRQAPSPRYRVYQLVPWLENAGLQCDVEPLIGESDYATARSSGKYLGKSRMLAAGLARRLSTLLRSRKYDLVYVLKGAFPYGPPVIEQLLRASNVPIIFDFDDAIHIHKKSVSHRFLDYLKSTRRVGQVAALANRVVVPNEYLANFAREFNPAVTVVPEAENTQRLVPRRPHKNGSPIVIGWVGSSSTAKYLTLIEDALRTICDRFSNVTLRVIGGRFEAEGIRTELVDWKFEREVQQFHDLDIGIMPLPLEEWSKGKSGCKLRQYMAAGVPGVGTAIGYNLELVDHGRTGFLATTQGEWIECLSKLIEDAELRNTIATAARLDVEQRFAINVIGPQLEAAIRETVDEFETARKTRRAAA